MAKKKTKKRIAPVNRRGLQSTSWSLNTTEIRRRRERLGLTMAQAAEAAGMSHRQAWYRLESGQRKSVSLATLIVISRVLKAKVDALLKFGG